MADVQNHPAAKRVKSPTARNPNAKKRQSNIPEKQLKGPATKRIRSPKAGMQVRSPLITSSPMMRLLVSPVVMQERSPVLPSHPVHRSLTGPKIQETGDMSDYGNQQSDMSVAQGCLWSDWTHHLSVQSKQTTSELEKYLKDELFPCDEEDFDILHWWKMHSTKYPIMACIARDILAVPASTVASESAFSTGSRVISDYRSSLSTSTVEALVCLQDWFRAAGPSYDHILSSVNLDVNEEDIDL